MEHTTLMSNYGRRREDLKNEEIETVVRFVVDILKQPVTARPFIEAIRPLLGNQAEMPLSSEKIEPNVKKENSERLVHWVHKWSFAAFIVLSSLSTLGLSGLVLLVKFGLITFPVVAH